MKASNKVTPEVREKRDEMRRLEFHIRPIIGDNIRRYRKNLQLRQEDIANLMGKNKVSVMNLELGLQETTMPVLLKLCEILKVTPNDLLLEKECSYVKRATGTLSSGN